MVDDKTELMIDMGFLFVCGLAGLLIPNVYAKLICLVVAIIAFGNIFTTELD